MHPSSPGRLPRGGSAFFPSRTGIPACPPDQAFRPSRVLVAVLCGLLLAALLPNVASVAGASLSQSASPQTPPAAAAKPSSSSPAKSASTAAKKKRKSAAAHKQLSPDPARIRQIQEALAHEGFYEGEPSGKWDDHSVQSMKSFQQAKGIQPTGKIEALSLQKLGLGSPVAGVAAPQPKSPPDPHPPVAPASPSTAPSRP